MKEISLNAYIQKSIEGDKNAFGTVMKEYSDYVFKLAYRIMQHEGEAEDIVQESFIKIWKNLGRYNSKIKFTTWIYKITINICFDQLRKKKRRMEISADRKELIKQVLSDEDPDKDLNNKEARDILIKLTEHLSNKQRMVFILQDIQELEPEEIKEITGMTKGQIKSNLYYARKAIKEQLINLGYDL